MADREPAERCITCGAEVAPGEGIRSSYGGEVRIFCSPQHQARFEQDPERYVGETQDLSRPPGYT
jgi:YHS domain-containing protein